MKSEAKIIDFKLLDKLLKAELLKLGILKLILISMSVSFLSWLIAHSLFSINAIQLQIMQSNLSIFINNHFKIFLFISFPILISTITSYLYSKEYDNRTIIWLRLMPFSPSNFFITKLIISFFYILLSLFTLQIFILVSYLILFTGYINFELIFRFLYVSSFYTIGIAISSIPILIIHLLISSFNVKLVVNVIVLLIATILSAYIFKNNFSEQWFNIYLIPLLMNKYLNNIIIDNHFNFNELSFFSTESIFFLIFITILLAYVSLFLSIKIINRIRI